MNCHVFLELIEKMEIEINIGSGVPGYILLAGWILRIYFVFLESPHSINEKWKIGVNTGYVKLGCIAYAGTSC